MIDEPALKAALLKDCSLVFTGPNFRCGCKGNEMPCRILLDRLRLVVEEYLSEAEKNLR